MKTKEELNEEELAQVSGGIGPGKFIGIMPGILIADTANSPLLMKDLKLPEVLFL